MYTNTVSGIITKTQYLYEESITIGLVISVVLAKILFQNNSSKGSTCAEMVLQ